MEFISLLLTNQLAPVSYSFKYQRQLKGKYFSRTLRSGQILMQEPEFDQLVQTNRVVLLSDAPGMGKTSFLQCFIERLSSALPDHVICLMHLKFLHGNARTDHATERGHTQRGRRDPPCNELLLCHEHPIRSGVVPERGAQHGETDSAGRWV
uniref:Uncharacterized protein n=1 Tax=Anopheles aquasalis TaxID=42839 RepID=T1E7V6_ANOAQ